MWNLDGYHKNIAVITENNEKISYQTLQNETETLAGFIQKRCLIFCFCKNTIGSLIGYTTFLNHNIVPLLLDSQLDKQFIDDLVVKYHPAYLWIPESMKNNFKEYKMVYCSCEYMLLRTEYDFGYELNDMLALLLPTSGSTGSPKLVRQSYANVQANMEDIAEYMEIDENERAITTLPMNYTYGLSIINSHLCKGATIIMTEKSLLQKEFWQQFRDFEATSFGGVPYTYEMLNKLKFYQMDLPFLKTITQAGGKLSPELHKKFAEYAIANDKKFVVMYGQTEATARMSYLPCEKSLEKYGSMGIAIPNGRFALQDSNGESISSANVEGELVYYGKNVTLGYAECGEDLKKNDERQGMLLTGDIAKFDEDGYYYIVGRKKRFLKIFGKRINLDETEHILKQHFDCMDIACSGKDDKMYIFLTNSTMLSVVKKFIVEKTGLNAVAFKVKKIEGIPKNDAGKIIYADLVKYYD